MGFFILITHKSTRLENPITWMECWFASAYNEYSIGLHQLKVHVSTLNTGKNYWADVLGASSSSELHYFFLNYFQIVF